MAMRGDYKEIIVESYRPASTSGLHGDVHIRPIEGQIFPPSLHVSSSGAMKTDFPVGTRFRILAKLTNRGDGSEYLYSNPQKPLDVVR